MDIYKYRLLGHKPNQHSPKLQEMPGPALELQDWPTAPKPGAACVTVGPGNRDLALPLLGP
jgi:hypothetical protein